MNAKTILVFGLVSVFVLAAWRTGAKYQTTSGTTEGGVTVGNQDTGPNSPAQASDLERWVRG